MGTDPGETQPCMKSTNQVSRERRNSIQIFYQNFTEFKFHIQNPEKNTFDNDLSYLSPAIRVWPEKDLKIYQNSPHKNYEQTLQFTIVFSNLFHIFYTNAIKAHVNKRQPDSIRTETKR